MKLTTITCTGDRPEAFALCEKYLASQTVQPAQMLVLDDGEVPTICTLGQQYIYVPHLRGKGSMVQKLRLALVGNLIKGDALVFWEDDDAYAPIWLEWCASKLAQFDLVGEGRAIYYNVQKRWWFEHANMQHASLCSTAMTRTMFPSLLRETANTEPFIDSRIWRYPVRKRVFDNSPRLVIGIKGMPGRGGYGGGHKPHDPSERADKDLDFLQTLIGDAGKAYAPFYQPDPEPLPNVGKSEFARVHGPNWLKWIGHLKGKPQVYGCGVGMDEQDSATWLKDNIFTDTKSRYYTVGGLPGPDFDPLDFAYCDGAHDAKSVLRDSVILWDMLKPGGILVWDDYHLGTKPDPLDRPAPAIDAFMNIYRRQMEIIFKGGQVAVKKVA